MFSLKYCQLILYNSLLIPQFNISSTTITKGCTDHKQVRVRIYLRKLHQIVDISLYSQMLLALSSLVGQLDNTSRTFDKLFPQNCCFGGTDSREEASLTTIILVSSRPGSTDISIIRVHIICLHPCFTLTTNTHRVTFNLSGRQKKNGTIPLLNIKQIC